MPIAARCIWTDRAQPISSAPSVRRTGNEMDRASDAHHTEGRTRRELKAHGWWTRSGRLRKAIRSAWGVGAGAQSAAGAAVTAKTAPHRKKHAETAGCAGFSAVRGRLPRRRLTRDNSCYRESIGQFRRFRRSARIARPVVSRLCPALPKRNSTCWFHGGFFFPVRAVRAFGAACARRSSLRRSTKLTRDNSLWKTAFWHDSCRSDRGD